MTKSKINNARRGRSKTRSVAARRGSTHKGNHDVNGESPAKKRKVADRDQRTPASFVAAQNHKSSDSASDIADKKSGSKKSGSKKSDSTHHHHSQKSNETKRRKSKVIIKGTPKDKRRRKNSTKEESENSPPAVETVPVAAPVSEDKHVGGGEA